MMRRLSPSTRGRAAFTLMEVIVGALIFIVVAGALMTGVFSVYRSMAMYTRESELLDAQQRVLDYLTFDAWNATTATLSGSTTRTLVFTVPRTYEIRRTNPRDLFDPTTPTLTTSNVMSGSGSSATVNFGDATITYTFSGTTVTRRTRYTNLSSVIVDKTVTLATELNWSFDRTSISTWASSIGTIAAPLNVTIGFNPQRGKTINADKTTITRALRPRAIAEPTS